MANRGRFILWLLCLALNMLRKKWQRVETESVRIITLFYAFPLCCGITGCAHCSISTFPVLNVSRQSQLILRVLFCRVKYWRKIKCSMVKLYSLLSYNHLHYVNVRKLYMFHLCMDCPFYSKVFHGSFFAMTHLKNRAPVFLQQRISRKLIG